MGLCEVLKIFYDKDQKTAKSYIKEFKLESIRLMNSSGKTSSQITVELGIKKNQRFKWKDQFGTKGGSH